MTLVDLYECYLKIDVDNDGVAETIQIFYAGDESTGQILDWQIWEDDVPFDKIECYPVPHKFWSEGVADRVKDIQRAKTTLLRQAVDNLYASNMPMKEVEAGSVLNPDILASPRFGGTIWRKKDTAPIIPHVTPFVADKAFNALQYFEEQASRRTGVSKTMMALDPEAISGQSATANQNAHDASYSQVELVARNMANGWRGVFRKILRLVVKHQDRASVIRLRGKFVEVDPRSWNVNMDVTVNVGLGTGSRQRDMIMLGAVAQAQEKLGLVYREAGMIPEAFQMIDSLRDTNLKMAESSGLNNPENYFPDVGEERFAEAAQLASQPKPDPQMELEKFKIQGEQQIQQARLQADVAKEKAQMEADIQTEAQRSQNDFALKQSDMELKRYQIDTDATIKREQMSNQRVIEMMKTSRTKPVEVSSND